MLRAHEEDKEKIESHTNQQHIDLVICYAIFSIEKERKRIGY